MKDRILAWVEEHKGERPDGRWYVYGLDWLGEEEFATEQALEDYLWRYASENPDCYLPMNAPQLEDT